MNRLFTERPLAKTGIMALLLIPLLALLQEYRAPKEKVPEGYNSSIIAFEFVSSPEELDLVLGPLNDKEIHDLDKLNYVDFGFMVLYGIFLFLFMARLGGIMDTPWLSQGKWIAPVIVICDALENVQLLKLTSHFQNKVSDLDTIITFLGIFTWLKWGLLALAFAMIGRTMTRMGQSKWGGYILYIPMALGIAAFVTDEARLEDLFGTSLFGAFFVIFVYCFFYKKEGVR